jgi:hypothetical protein
MSPEDQVHSITQHIVEFARAHEMWAAPIVGALAFAESLAFISVVLPAWAVLVALGCGMPWRIRWRKFRTSVSMVVFASA